MPRIETPQVDESTRRVLAWLDEPPYFDPARRQRAPNFSYEAWEARGRKLPHVSATLVDILNALDPLAPSDLGMRAAGALMSQGDKSKAVSDALVRMLRNHYPLTSISAAAALGVQADARGIKALEAILADRGADANNRANAALSIAKLAPPEARSVLEREAHDPSETVRYRVEKALGMLAR